MQSGQLTETIQILSPVEEKSEFGTSKISYKQVYSTRAKLEYRGGTRAVQNSEILHTKTKTLKVRYYVKVSESDRIVWNDETYQILSIEPCKAWNEKTIEMELVNE